MIDIHSHILPGLDDGAKDVEIALEMVRIAEREGIKKIIATPHVIPGDFDLNNEDILLATKKLNSVLIEHNITVKVLPGAECYLDFDLAKKIKEAKVLTLGDNGKYILIELPMQSFPDYAMEVFFEILLQGITPILAHPERNFEIIKNPEILFDLVSKGVLTQVNATSLTGAFGKTVAKTAQLYLEHNWVHFLATDCHSCGTRGPRLKEAYDMVVKMVGKDKAEELVLVNPQKVIDGEAIIIDDIKEYSPNKGIWGRIKSKLF